MKIVNKNPSPVKVGFNKIKVGEVFLYGGALYLKAIRNNSFNAITLGTANPAYICYDTVVTPVKAHVVVEKEG